EKSRVQNSVTETAKFVSGREIIWNDNNSVLDRQRADQTISGGSKKHKHRSPCGRCGHYWHHYRVSVEESRINRSPDRARTRGLNRHWPHHRSPHICHR